MSLAAPLDYAPRPRLRLKRLLRWIIGGLILVAIVATAVWQREWLTEQWELFQIRRAERACGSFDFGKGTVVLETDPNLAARMLHTTASAIPIQLPGPPGPSGAGRRLDMGALATSEFPWTQTELISAPTVFCHELHGPDGRRFLMRAHIEFRDDRFEFHFVWKTLIDSPKEATGNYFYEVLTNVSQRNIRIFAGEFDPHDPAAFTIPFLVDGHMNWFVARLDPEEHLAMRIIGPARQEGYGGGWSEQP